MLDPTTHVDTVSRGLRTTELDGHEVRIQTLAQTYPSPLAEVWDAVTAPDRIGRWFGPITADARLGGRYQIEGNAGGEVLSCAAPDADAAGYRVTWEYGGGTTWLAVDLEAVGDDATRLTLTHTARSADIPEGFWEQYGPGATGVGWDMGLLGLAMHLRDADDAEVGAANAQQWQVGEAGRRFSRAAADGWADAHMADGGEPEAARRAADATFAFYTGEEVDPKG